MKKRVEKVGRGSGLGVGNGLLCSFVMGRCRWGLISGRREGITMGGERGMAGLAR